jgi:8-oxo-dGTP pyrophosphatase MutT (NUDIX family)
VPDDEPAADRPTSWPVSATRYLHRGDWVISLREDVVGRPRQPQDRFVRWTVEHPGAVVVLAVDDDERVLCLRQYRHPGRHEFVELPAGLRDEDGEDPLVTAQRELREEAELAATDWRLLLSTYPSAGLTEEVHEIYLARGLSHADRGDFELHAEEAEMEAFWVPMGELLEAVLEGRVREGPLAQAVLAYDVLQRRGALG